MVRYILKRILWLIPTAIGVYLIIVLVSGITPGMPKMAGGGSSPGTIDGSFLGRSFKYLTHAAVGDLGLSLKTGREIADEIAIRFPYTLFIVTVSVLFATVIGVPLGIYSATHHRTWKDRTSVVSSLVFVSMPDFLIMLIFIIVFGVKLRWLPIFGIESWKGWILPIVSLSFGYTASIVRQTRSSMLDQLRQGYVLTARAKGQSESKIIYRHALKNALIPIILTIGTTFGVSLSGVFIVETMFSLPGLGVYTLSAVFNRDFPALQGVTLYMSLAYSVIILIIDVSFALANPRIRSLYEKKQKKLSA